MKTLFAAWISVLFAIALTAALENETYRYRKCCQW